MFSVCSCFILLGESIAISADFENYSSRTIIPYATLHQTQTFFANGKSRVRGTKFTVLTGNISFPYGVFSVSIECYNTFSADSWHGMQNGRYLCCSQHCEQQQIHLPNDFIKATTFCTGTPFTNSHELFWPQCPPPMPQKFSCHTTSPGPCCPWHWWNWYIELSDEWVYWLWLASSTDLMQSFDEIESLKLNYINHWNNMDMYVTFILNAA